MYELEAPNPEIWIAPRTSQVAESVQLVHTYTEFKGEEPRAQAYIDMFKI